MLYYIGMDNLETLFQKGEYDLIVKLTELSIDPKELLLRISSLVALTKYDEALDEIEKHQIEIEKLYLLRLMKLHFELLLMKKLYDDARINLSHYENLPYVSQEVEEFLKEMKERIEDESHQTSAPKFSFDEMFEIIEKDTNMGNVSNVLFSLKNYNINVFIDSIKILLTRKDVHPNLRTYALILLVDNKIDDDFEVLIDGKTLVVNPNKIKPPFSGENFKQVTLGISQKSEQNITLAETSLHLLNCYIIDTYPLDIFEVGIEALVDAFIHIGKTYLKIDSNADEKVKEIADKIRSTIESTPDIKL